jgi:hypothetical protein
MALVSLVKKLTGNSGVESISGAGSGSDQVNSLIRQINLKKRRLISGLERQFEG